MLGLSPIPPEQDMLVERCCVYIMIRLIEAGQIPEIKSHADFARAVWPDRNAPQQTWQFLQTGRAGKLQALSVSDLIRFARVAQVTPDRILQQAVFMVQEGLYTDKDDPRHKNRKKSGRKPSE